MIAETSSAEETLASLKPGDSVFLVGIGGSGMSRLAHLLMDRGLSVLGSDCAPNGESQRLAVRGVRVFDGHSASHMDGCDAKIIVISSAIPGDNPEVAVSRSRNLPVFKRAEVLSAIMRQAKSVAVAGMHGKTTTSALLAFVLSRLGSLDAFAIGGAVPQLDEHRSGAADGYFIAETDESDGTLALYHPEQTILLNVDEEHLDHFSGIGAIKDAFRLLSEQTSGRIFFCSDDDYLMEICSGRTCATSYGFSEKADYRVTCCEPFANHGGAEFELTHEGMLLGRFELKLFGRVNVLNAAGVLAFLHMNGFDLVEVRKWLAEFHGVRRRQELLAETGGVLVYDDYGHHPSEVEATLAGFKLMGRRLLVAFQPHRHTRTAHLMEQFAGCFKSADRLWLADIYSAGENPIDGVSSELLALKIRESGQQVDFLPNLRHLARSIAAARIPGDLIVYMGAGDMTHVAREFANELKIIDSQIEEIRRQVSEMTRLRAYEPLAKKTTLRVGGAADIYCEPASEADLVAVLRYCKRSNLPVFILGRGSNLLVRDGGIRGVVLSLMQPDFSKIERVGERIYCGAGAKLKEVSLLAKKQGLAGFEFLEGIPGSIGGALRMNAGAMNGATFDIVESVRLVGRDGTITELPASEVPVSYRSCSLLKDHIALGAVLCGRPDAVEAIGARMDAYSQKRWKSQPKESSAGCIFKNLESCSAGKLIDELGLKGLRIGGASVSTVHGNFIVNDGGATAVDVLNLIELLKTRVREARGVELHTEVEIVGEP